MSECKENCYPKSGKIPKAEMEIQEEIWELQQEEEKLGTDSIESANLKN